tara:strand:+ start:81 stop:293 length:213 start_codon:yes stop_codon:yes gene_type:complete
MTPEYIDQLIAMLSPGCDDQTIVFVRQKLLENFSIVRESPTSVKRSDQQKVDVYASEVDAFFNPNDPVNW